jgi:hypothetical protein
MTHIPAKHRSSMKLTLFVTISILLGLFFYASGAAMHSTEKKAFTVHPVGQICTIVDPPVSVKEFGTAEGTTSNSPAFFDLALHRDTSTEPPVRLA